MHLFSLVFGPVADVIERINKLLQLSTSDNENEARSSALSAAKLILKHKIVLVLPGSEPKPAAGFSPPYTPPVSPEPPKSSPPRKVKDLFGNVWLFHDHGTRFAGHCVFCALPTFVGHATYVSDQGALHVGCWTDRQSGKVRPGPAPSPRASRPVVESMRPTPEDKRAEADAVSDLWEKIGFGKQ